MRWEDCVKRDMERVGGELRRTTKDRRSWRLLIENVVREKQEEREDEEEMTVAMPNLAPDAGATRGEQQHNACQIGGITRLRTASAKPGGDVIRTLTFRNGGGRGRVCDGYHHGY